MVRKPLTRRVQHIIIVLNVDFLADGSKNSREYSVNRVLMVGESLQPNEEIHYAMAEM